MKRFNNITSLGLAFNGIWLVSSRFNLLSDFAEGFCVGIGLTFIFIGIYAENHDMSAFSERKKAIFKRILGK